MSFLSKFLFDYLVLIYFFLILFEWETLKFFSEKE